MSDAKPNPLDLLDIPDQTGIEADLTTFFGPHPKVYLSTYRKMLAKRQAGQKAAYVTTMNVAAFFLSYAWFSYRKLYGCAALVVGCAVVIGYFMRAHSSAGIILAMICGLMSNYIYVLCGLRCINMADRQSLTGAERQDYLAKAGGVSKLAGAIALTIWVITIALALWGILAVSQFKG